MKKNEAVLGGCILGVILAVILTALLVCFAKLDLKEDLLQTIATFLLVVATIALAWVAERQRTSAEDVAKRQIDATDKLAKEQTYSIKWMEQQKTKPYCDFIIVVNTSSPKALGVYLKNFGNGPALKLKWKFTYEKAAIPETGREEVA